MSDIETAPELDDIDEAAEPFKRRLAVVVVLITLFGAIVAYLQTVESNKEDNAARNAAISAVSGLGAQVDASARFASASRVLSQSDVLLQRQAINAGRANQSASGSAESFEYAAAAERLAAVRAAIAAASPLTRPREADEDPIDPVALAASFEEGPDVARLRQTVEATLANDHGGKADTFVAILTVLAVALFLIGLSLTVQGTARYALALPGCVIAGVCLLWSLTVATRHVASVSDLAIRQTAEGQRLTTAENFDGAIAAFSTAIDDSPDFAAAYARRGEAQFLQGSPQLGQTQFISVTSETALRQAIRDMKEAVDRGADGDISTVADLGFFLFLDGEFGQAADFSEQALELNDQLPEVWFNLAVARVGQGDRDGAEEAYRQGKLILGRDPDAFRRGQVLAAARTDLQVVRTIVDSGDRDRVERIAVDAEADLADFEESQLNLPCPAEGACPSASDVGSDGEAVEFTISRNGSFVQAEYSLNNVEPNTPITNVWYFRTDPDQPFTQTALSTTIDRVVDPSLVFSLVLANFDPACPVPGEYQIQVFAGDRLIGRGDGEIVPGPLGERFTSLIDQVEGFEACVPEGFEVQRDEIAGDENALDDPITAFQSETLLLGVNVTPGASQAGSDPEVETENLLRAVAGAGADIQAVDFQARTVGQIPFFLSARMAVLDDGSGAIAVSVGPDGVARSLTLIGSTDLATLEDLVSLVTFTQLPESALPSE